MLYVPVQLLYLVSVPEYEHEKFIVVFPQLRFRSTLSFPFVSLVTSYVFVYSVVLPCGVPFAVIDTC